MHRFRSTPLHNFPFHLDVTCILGIKIDSSLHSVTEEHRTIVQLRPISNLLRSTIWITSGLLVVFEIIVRNFALGFPVALHWLVLLQEEVEQEFLGSSGNSLIKSAIAP